jgi:hypothetical protein
MGIGGITPAQKLKAAAQILLKRPAKNGNITIRISHRRSPSRLRNT